MDRNHFSNDCADYISDDGDERDREEYDSHSDDLDVSPSPDSSEDVQPQFDLAVIVDHRRKKRRGKEIQAAVVNMSSLSSTVQQHLLGIHLKGGWGMFSHGMARHFKAPSRYGHKLVDLAILTTIHDRTVALVAPHQVMFVALTIEDFVDDVGKGDALGDS